MSHSRCHNVKISNFISTLNIPNSEGGINSSHLHNPTKSQRYGELKILSSDTKVTNTCSSTIDSKKLIVCF